MKIKEHPDFPKLRVRFLSDNNTPHQLGICEGRKQLHAEAGEIELDQWLKENGWVKEDELSCNGMPLGEWAKRYGYTKLSDVELDVEIIEDILDTYDKNHGEYHQRVIAALFNNLKDLLKIKEK